LLSDKDIFNAILEGDMNRYKKLKNIQMSKEKSAYDKYKLKNKYQDTAKQILK